MVKPTSEHLRTAEEARVWSTFRAFKAGIMGAKGEMCVREALSALGASALHDVIVRDQRGLTQIDHLVRAPDAILVLETKRYNGIISGDLDDVTWTQRFTNSLERFELPNPRRQNYRHLKAVEAVIGTSAVMVRSYIVAAGSAVFEGELQDALVPLAELGRIVTGRTSLPQRWLGEAWDRLQVVAARSPGLREAHQRKIVLRRR